MSEGKIGISKTMFAVGIIAAILVSSLISVVAVTQIPFIKGPKGDKGDTGATGATGATGTSGDASLPSTAADAYPPTDWATLDAILYSLDLDQSKVGNQQSVFVSEGTTITVTGEFQILSPYERADSTPSYDIRQAFFLFSWTPSWPVPNSTYYQVLYNGVPGAFPGVTQTFSFSLTVPSQTGVYHLYFCAARQYDMQGAVSTYAQKPSMSHATIIVAQT